MDIRPYTPADRDACLEIFDSNSPDLIPHESRPQFIAILDTSPNFFIAEHNNDIVGCGGFEISGEAARLHWGMVHRRWQRQGLGRFLLFYRLREITRHSDVQMVELEAPRQSAAFFASQGFREIAGDSARVEMSKRLIVCS
jgi:N-acetylglutamate synthase-like GNAT family acetyltransferase